MGSLKLFESLIVGSMLLAAGIAHANVIEQRQDEGEVRTCRPQTSTAIRAEGGTGTITLENTVDKCTCIEDGKELKYQDGTDCMVISPIRDEEQTHKHGTCHNGVCKVTQIPRGCKGKEPKGNKVPPQVGCTFTCTNDRGQKEYNYLPVNTTCKHYEDGNFIETTCKRAGFNGKTVCRVNPPVLPAC